MIDIFPAIVVYNKQFDEILTCTSSLKQGVVPIVVDNSNVHNDVKERCLSAGINYISMNGNQGLAKAYNAVLDNLAGKTGYVLWLDDDTVLPEDFYLALRKNIYDSNAKLFLSVVQVIGTNDIISPCIFGKYRMRQVENIDELYGKRISAINSGMLVDLAVYEKFRYDENMFLDYIDHDFMVHIYERGISSEVMKNVILLQHFSRKEKSDSKNMKRRREIFASDYRYYCRKHGFSRIAADSIVLYRHLKELF